MNFRHNSQIDNMKAEMTANLKKKNQVMLSMTEVQIKTSGIGHNHLLSGINELEAQQSDWQHEGGNDC